MTPSSENTSTSYSRIRSKLRTAGEIAGTALTGAGVWLLSIIATLCLPCLPLFIEWIKTSHLKTDTVTLTAAVLAAGLIFTSEHVIYFSLYFMLFLVNLVINTSISPASPPGLDKWDSVLMLSIAILHASERFWWHVVLVRPFLLWGNHRDKPIAIVGGT